LIPRRIKKQHIYY